MKSKKLLAAALAMSFVLSSCGGEGKKGGNEANSTSNPSSQVSENEVAEGEEGNVRKADPFAEGEKDEVQYLNTWYQEEPTTLNSAKGSDASSISILMNVMEPLARNIETSPGKFEIVPGAAESWDISDDGKTYTFHLRDNKWSDGKPVTAKDYEFGLQTAADVETGAGGLGWLVDCIEGVTEAMAGEKKGTEIGVKAIDDKTLEIKLVEKTPYFLELVATRPAFPIREDVYKEMGEKYGTEAENIVTNGPFKIDSWTHNTEIKLSKNENYWDADNVSYDNVSWKIMEDENSRFNAFLNGEIDSVGTTQEEWQQQFEAKEDVVKSVVQSSMEDYLFFNTKEKPFNNKKVRLAFSLALNRQEAIDAVYNGVGEPATGWVMPAVAMNGKSYREQVGNPLEDVQKENTDPKALLEEGLKEEGIDPKDFKPLLEFGGTSEKMKEIGDYFINAYKESLGIDLSVKTNEWVAFSDQVRQGNFQIGYMAWGADYNDPYCMLSLFLAKNNGVLTGYDNPEYDKLVEEGKAADSDEERLDKYFQAEKIICEDAPAIPIYYGVSHVYRYDYLRGYSDNPFSTQGMKTGYTSGRQ